MALVPGGDDTNLITGILNGDTVNVTFGRHVWIAQCFTLPVTALAWRVAVKLGYQIATSEYLEYGIRWTAAGKPTGDDMDFTRHGWMRGRTIAGGLWWPQSFPKWLVLGAEEWALIIRVPGADVPWACYARAAPELPPGVTGKAWKSTDSGENWTEIEGYFLLHQVWGTPKVTPIPPPKEVSNWAPMDYSHLATALAYRVRVDTNAPVHLWMRYSFNQPLKHKVERFRRGLAMPWNTYYCFTAWLEVEQNEPGDTLEHTFSFYDWPVCQTRWFYFTGTKRMYPTPSASPIYELHRYEPTPTRIAWSRRFSTGGTFRYLDPGEGHAAVFRSPSLPTALTTAHLYTRTNDPATILAYLYAVDAQYRPTGFHLANAIIDQTKGTLIQTGDGWRTVYQHTVALPWNLTPDTPYAIVSIGTEGRPHTYLRFDSVSWEGDKDEGWENHITLKWTDDYGETWVSAYPYYQCYEVWGEQ